MKKFILTLFIFNITSSIGAPSNISLVFPLVDGWAHKTEKAYAPAAIKSIFNKRQEQASLNFRPFKRALVDFQQGRFDCFVGGDEKTMLDFAKVKTISSKLIRNTSLRLYTLKKNKKQSTLKEALNKNVIYVRGLDLASLDQKFKHINSVTSVKQAVGMMKAGRVDVLMHWFPSTQEIMKDFHTDDSIILYTIKEKVNCHINARNIKFIKSLDSQITKFKSRGDLNRLHKHFYGKLPFNHSM